MVGNVSYTLPTVALVGMMATKGYIRSSSDRTLLGEEGFRRQEYCALVGAFFSNVMGVPRLSRSSDDGANPFMSLCCIGLRLERGFGEHI